VNGICVDSSSTNIYAVAFNLNGIWKIPIGGSSFLPVSSALWIWLTSPAKAYGQIVDGPIGISVWANPSAVNIDGHDNLYILDNYESFTTAGVPFGRTAGLWNYALRRVDTVNGFVSTIVGKAIRAVGPTNAATSGSVRASGASSQYSYGDGNGTTAGLSRNPGFDVSAYIAVSSGGDKLYLTDYASNVVRRVTCGPGSRMAYGVCNGPSKIPSCNPTLCPTVSPSINPTVFPSMPTSGPSRRPSRPSSEPSRMPLIVIPPSYSPSYLVSYSQYVRYSLSANALYQPDMNISLASGQKSFFNDLSGIGKAGAYNGAYGIGFDNSNQYAFVAAVESKKLRKLRLSDHFVGDDITRKFLLIKYILIGNLLSL